MSGQEILPKKLAKHVPKKFRALEYALEGHSAEDVARKFGYMDAAAAQRAVYIALGDAHLMENAAEVRRREVLKCEKIQRAAWRAFKRSCEDAVTLTLEDVITGKDAETGEPIIHTLTRSVRKGQAGDASLLRIILDAMRRRADLEALDLTPPKTHGANVTVNVGTLTDEQLISIAARGVGGAGATEATSIAVEPAGVHQVHVPRLSGPLAPPIDCRPVGPSGEW